MSSITCDVCKKSLDLDKDILEAQEFIIVKFVGGYASIFGDGNIVECNICQECFEFTFRGNYRIVGNEFD